MSIQFNSSPEHPVTHLINGCAMLSVRKCEVYWRSHTRVRIQGISEGAVVRGGVFCSVRHDGHIGVSAVTKKDERLASRSITSHSTTMARGSTSKSRGRAVSELNAHPSTSRASLMAPTRPSIMSVAQVEEIKMKQVGGQTETSQVLRQKSHHWDTNNPNIINHPEPERH